MEGMYVQYVDLVVALVRLLVGMMVGRACWGSNISYPILSHHVTIPHPMYIDI